MGNPSIHATHFADVVNAAQRLAGHVHRTPVLENCSLNERASRQFERRLFFKCENLQKVGAFKFRGAFNAVSQLNDEQKNRGVVTHSSGNHAQALALAAAMSGTPAWIVMPVSASRIKRDAVNRYGATVIECESNLQAREQTAAQVQSETGATLIHPYDNPNVIAGQGTAALELVEQVSDLDLIIAPVGGGGLLSGTAIVAHHFGIDVVGAEPSGADDAARSMASGQRILQTAPDTIADGLLTSLGELTWPVIRDLVLKILTVDDFATIEWMKFFWERTKHIIEPSSAVAVAVAMSDTVMANNRWRRIGVVLSGGNVDLSRLPWSTTAD